MDNEDGGSPSTSGEGESGNSTKGKDGDSKKRKLSGSEPVDIHTPTGVQNGPALPPWVAGGSPARFVAPDDLMKMSVAMDNLALIHEIAIDPEYSVPDVPADPIHAAVRHNMHRAYWDLLREDLAKDPPDYTQAFSHLMEIKETILNDILSVAHVRLRAEVEFVLNENTLRNKLEQNCLDVHEVARFIVNLLGRLCAPERDTIVEKLRREEGIVELISGIFELMDLMKTDLTNYVLSRNRAAVEEYSSKFEYKEFLKYLDNYPEGANETKAWLEAAYRDINPSTSTSNEEPKSKKEKSNTEEVNEDELLKTTGKAYVKLVLTRNPAPFPETLRIDRTRLEALSEKFLQMNIVTSAVLITCNIAGKEVSEIKDFKRCLKDKLIIITNDVDESKLRECLEAIGEECVKTASTTAISLGKNLSSEQEDALRKQIKAIEEESNAIRSLVGLRISQFVEEILQSASEVQHRIQPGLSVIQKELRAFTARLLRLCVHNRRTFSELYKKLLKEIKSEHTSN
ncbi:hypothetical protein Q1695_011806 [Nippostrongylus brasiliensis]|nr:hypothetical protein Q1695_011806 [Nippostrongylus brasiliensis]